MKTIREHYLRNREVYAAVGEAAGAIAFFGLLFAFCWLCCACSGYHWE